jgi:hypothetical protein
MAADRLSSVSQVVMSVYSCSPQQVGTLASGPASLPACSVPSTAFAVDIGSSLVLPTSVLEDRTSIGGYLCVDRISRF